MNARSGNVKIAKETIKITSDRQYVSPSGKTVDLSFDIDLLLDSTTLYQEEIIESKNYDTLKPVIEVTNETTSAAAVRLEALGKTGLVALNFASGRNQGGGFLSGAIAQEEDLCRASALYASLKRKPIFYNENLLCEDNYYTDNVIYSPNVPFFRDEHNMLLEDPYKLSIISAPAPNMRSETDPDTTKLYNTFLRRAVKVLQVAEVNEHKNIILGAWGCGAFGNDPVMVADAFKEALTIVPSFEHVCFAVYDTRDEQPVFNMFKEVFEVE